MLYFGIFAATLMMLIGSWIFMALNKRFPKGIDLLLAASAGLLLGMIFFGIFPEAWEMFEASFDEHHVPAFIAAVAFGVLLIVGFEKLIPVHHHHEIDESMIHSHDHKRMTLVVLMAFGFHSVFELLSILVTGAAEPMLAWGLVLVIGLHNIPIGFVISAQMELYGISRKQSVGMLTGLAVFETLLTVMIFMLLRPWVTLQLQSILLAMTSGVMLYLVFDELLPKVYREEDQHSVNYTVIFGILVMLAFLKIAGH